MAMNDTSMLLDENLKLLAEIERLRAELAQCYQSREGWMEQFMMAQAHIAELEKVMLTPEQLRALADWMLRHGDLDNNAVCLTALTLRSKADALAAVKDKP